MSTKTILACLACGQTNRVPVERLRDQPKCGSCSEPLLPGKPVAVSFQTLEKAILRDKFPLLVDYWAPWCGPCRMMAPEFEKAAAMLATEVRLLKIDTEQHPDASVRWNIRGIPAFILFAEGREVGRLAGARPAQDVVNFARTTLDKLFGTH